MRHLISLKENSSKDIKQILGVASDLKKKRSRGVVTNYLRNKTLLMLFQKTSTRTRLSFETGMTELGGHAIFLDSRTTQVNIADFTDEIKAIMSFGHILMIRALRVQEVELAAKQNRIPVIDACSEKYHPCQALGDLLTMVECVGSLSKLKKIAWLGIENNVSNTLKMLCSIMGITISIISPEADSYSVDPNLNALVNKSHYVDYTTDIKKGLKDAQFVHTDTWMNMEFFENGKIRLDFKAEYERREKVFEPFQLSSALISKYCKDAKIMHCMPCHVGYEISRDAIDHQNSLIFSQAENRLHIQKGIMLWLLNLI